MKHPDNFIEKIANRKLNIYQNIIQYGSRESKYSKEGQSLTLHILNCVFTAAKLSEIFNIPKPEQELLMVALVLHDINKLPESPKRLGYKHIANIENIENEIIKLDIPDFMPNWKESQEDIKILLHAHSGHSNLQGDLLNIMEDNTNSGKDRLEQLKFIVRACDVADLSKHFTEKNKKDEFLFNVNSFARTQNQQYKLISHKVLEQRGNLTNLLHKNTMEYFQKKFNAVPIFLYPEGTYYLVPVSQKIEVSEEDKKLIGIKVKNNLDKLKKSKFGEYIGKDQKQGIKVAPEIIGLATIEDIFSIIDFKIQKKKYKIEDKENEDRNKLSLKLQKAKSEEKPKIERLLLETKFYGDTQESMKLGELIRTFYIFLSAHCDKRLNKINKSYKDTWVYIYEILNFPVDKIDLYSASDSLYQRAFMVSKHIDANYEDLLKKFKLVINDLMEEKEVSGQPKDEETDDIVEYTISNTVFYFDNNIKIDFEQKLKNYMENNHKQCSCCNSSFKTNPMMKSDVPDKISVQQFSNRLLGGPGEPKRNICSICKEQFSLEKLNFSVGDEKPLYLHMTPHSFMPQEFLVSLKNTFNNFVGEEISAFYINVKDTLKLLKENGYLSLKINKSNSFGMGVPKYPDEVLGNMLIIPLNSIKLNNTERYLRAIDYALFLNRYFNFKIVVTESAIPIFNKDEFDEIFFDGLPANLRGFVETQNLNKDDVEVFWEKYIALRNIADTLYSDDSYIKLVLGLIKGKQNLFYTVDRLIEEKLRKSKSNTSTALAQYLSKEIYSSVELIINS